MKCLVPGANLKILGRAVHAAAKLGDELHLESSRAGLALRTLNAAESAYCIVTFDKTFFTYYDYNCASADGDRFKCKISTKSALTVFKSPAQMDKQVDVCEIKLDPKNLKLVFRMRCKHGIVKTHFVSVLEGKKMEASYSKDGPNRLTADARVFSDAVGNFKNSDDQITFEANPQTTHLRNYIDENVDSTKSTRTQLCLKSAEFESYVVGVDARITFSMREFRAFLSFAEAANLPTVASFRASGDPVVFAAGDGSTFEADFVLATEKPDGVTQRSDRTRPSADVSERKRGRDEPSRDDEADSFNFAQEPNRKRTFRSPESDVGAAERENSVSPIIFSQRNKIKTIFRRCFDTTLDPSTKNQSLSILADESDCD